MSKPDITISITGTSYAPSWETVERMIEESIFGRLIRSDEDRRGKLIRIARRDKGVNYTAPGEYDLTWHYFHDHMDIQVALIVDNGGRKPSNA